MDYGFLRRAAVAAGVFFGVWAGVKFLLPVLLPFLLGGLLALAAEPVVALCVKKAGLPRGLSAGIGVTATLVLTAGVISLVGALAVRQLGRLAGMLPEMEQTVRQGITVLTEAMPEGVRRVTGDGEALLEGGLLSQSAQRLTGAVTAALGRVTEGALGLGTGVVAGFMISARLPQLRESVKRRLPAAWETQILPRLRRGKVAVSGWLKAQGKLAAVTFGLTALGLTVLGVRYGFAWAALVAAVDAVPMLGTGVVLVPWALVAFLQGEVVRGAGLTAVFLVTMVVRRILEPKMVGRHLDLDPLVTLVFLYGGYRFWGVGGMIAAPLLAAAVKGMTEEV